MKEFVCPNGRLSVNGVCGIFEGDDGQIKDFQKPKTFDDTYMEIEDIEKDRKKGVFKFDFEKNTPSKFETANNILGKNIEYYNNFVESNLGIPSNVQTAFRVGASAASAFGGGSLVSVVAPFAIPFVIGGALKSADEKRIEKITMQDPQGDIQTFNTAIMNIPSTPQDDYRGGQYSGGNTKSSSSGSKSGGFSSAERGAALHG